MVALVAALAAGLLGGPPAATAAPPVPQEVEHPRQQWLRDSTAGLFLHWGMYTAPAHTDCRAWEKSVTDGGWSADYWVDEAKKLGASYIVLATFHSRLGYARPWPSKIPGSCATERDLLGELVKAGQAKGVKVILYMTDDPQWHNETGTESLDSAAYSKHKGKDVDLTTREGFGEFSYDLFHEVMDRYDDLAGFWIDNDNEYWEEHHLYEQIREKRPSWLLSNNNEDTPIMDTVSNEQKTGMTPSYDYPQAAFTPMPRLTEADYKLPTEGAWWYDGKDHPVDYRLSTGRYVANAGSSMKSLMAETPMVNGKMPPAQEKFNDFMSTWAPPIRESLARTEGGGYLYGGLQPGFWNDGAHGVVTVAKEDDNTQYVHVLTRPGGDLLRLRDNGYDVTEVTDLRTGKPLRFSQSGGYLNLLGITAWDRYDTVFKVETAGQRGYYDPKSLKATASSAAAGHPAANLVDGTYPGYWDSDRKVPASLTIDLGHRRAATTLAVNQRESSPTHARVSFGRPEDSARIKDYTVRASDDGKRWRKVRTGVLPSARGVRFIDLGAQRARYLKLDVHSLWGGAQAPEYHNRLQIDEIKVGHGFVESDPSAAPLEAEAPANGRTGRARSERCAGCSGGRQVTGLGGGTANALTYHNVRAAEGGDYRLQLDHTAAAATSLSVRVNGGEPRQVAVPASRADVPGSTSVPVSLRAGANTVQIYSTDRHGPGVDRVELGTLPPESSVPKTTMTVRPHGLQWVGKGAQSIRVTAKLRLDDDTVLDGLKLAPKAPDGWQIEGAPVTADQLRLGGTIEGEWTITSPAGRDVTSAQLPVTAAYSWLGRAHEAQQDVGVRARPADRVWMREAEDSANGMGSTGLTGCSPCSGGEKVRNIGGSAAAAVTFPQVTVDKAGMYRLYLDYTVNGTRSFFVSANGGPAAEAKVSGSGNSTPATTSVAVQLKAGVNELRVFNDAAGAPDLDRLSLAP
ncbi:alpha-L-fucosidase [Streptomyces boninensis]|uniref:alpha-L-fucosidase n=1 Tax=Streptomyces boninensis TaxID=2039455 RepID=UPI003B2128D8